jgi:hypothetical protein
MTTLQIRCDRKFAFHNMLSILFELTMLTNQSLPSRMSASLAG